MSLTVTTLATLIARRFKIDPARITPEATLEELGFDSLSNVDLIVLLEREAGIRISDEESSKMSSIKDILDFAASFEPAQ